MKKLITLTTVMSVLFLNVYSQEPVTYAQEGAYVQGDTNVQGYQDSRDSTYSSAAYPLAAIAIATVLVFSISQYGSGGGSHNGHSGSASSHAH